jgi:hypothetical protein
MHVYQTGHLAHTRATYSYTQFFEQPINRPSQQVQLGNNPDRMRLSQRGENIVFKVHNSLTNDAQTQFDID